MAKSAGQARSAPTRSAPSRAAGTAAPEPMAAGDATYTVVLPTFEGPLDLLLHLVQKHELSILDLPVSFITEKYLEYISMMRVLQIDIASEYLVMAATLAHLKSKTLLPPEVTEAQVEVGEDGEPIDPREELIRRLLEYQKYKDAAERLGERSVTGRDVFTRPALPSTTSAADAPLADLSVFRLIEAFQSIVSRSKVKVQHEVEVDKISITQRILELCDVLRSKPKVQFDELFNEATTRFDLVISFLALLEMTRLRMTRVYQAEPYAPIHIELALTDDDALASAKDRLPPSF